MQAYKQETGGVMAALMVAVLIIMGGSTAFMAMYPVPEWALYVMCGSTALVAFFMIVFRRLNVTVDESGVCADWGGIIRKRIPLDDIAEVRVEPYRWLQFGGWGWRFNLGGDVAFSQIGVSEALNIRRKNGKRLVVTLRNPQEAADAVHDWMGA